MTSTVLCLIPLLFFLANAYSPVSSYGMCPLKIDADSVGKCFHQRADHAVSRAAPVAELFQVSAMECLHYCVVNSPKAGVSLC